MNATEMYIAFMSLVTKEILRFTRIWIQTLLPAMITTALYFVIFGQLIGAQISPIAGYSYMEYIVPGLILMTVITNSYANVVSSFYGGKFMHYVDELLVSPMPNWLVLCGYMVGGVLRGLMVGVAVMGVSALFVDFHIHDVLVTLIVAILTALLFSLGGFLNALFAKSFDDISLIPTFVLTPLTYLGGVFYSVDMLPEGWREVSLLNPILYMVNAFRYGLLGVSDIPLVLSFGITLGFVALLYVINLTLLNRGYGLRS